MPLRRSPVLTPRALAARRANALKSTGPRTAAGKARSCLNALRHGRRARDLRGKFARIGDSEALFLLDWFQAHILRHRPPPNERWWRYTVRLAARVWCYMNGRSLRPRAGAAPKPSGQGPAPRVPNRESRRGRRKPEIYRYGTSVRCPRQLQISKKRGPGIRFVNPTPSRRKHVLLGWLPEFHRVPGPPPKPKRARRLLEQAALGPVTPTTGLARAKAGTGAQANYWIPALAGERVLGSRRPNEELAGPLGIMDVTKKEVRTKLESAEESMTCSEFENDASAASMKRFSGGFRTCSGAENFDRPAAELGPDPEFLSGEASVAELFDYEPFGYGGPTYEDFEACDAEHELIKMQWARCRQVLAECRDEHSERIQDFGAEATVSSRPRYGATQRR